jgi:cell division protein FtsW
MNSKNGSFDLPLLVIVFTLLAVGVMMVSSASAPLAYEKFADSYYFLKRQLIWISLGITGMLLAMRINYKIYRKISPYLLLISVALLVLIFFPQFGRKVSGATRWIKIGGSLGFQPSELVKLTLIIYTASLLSKKEKKIAIFTYGLLPRLIIAGAIISLILFQPDLGTALTLGIVIFLLFFLGGARVSHLFLLFLTAVPILYLLIFKVGYRKDRILAFLNPESDPLGIGFHIRQSLLALGSGGLTGKGLGKSIQKFLYLPQPHNDFIYAVLGEEFGFIGTASVAILFLLFLIRGVKIAASSSDLFGNLLASGITFLIVWQAFLNMGVVTKILPITGIPLPFISFGGSSLLFTMMGIGILLNISRSPKENNVKGD